MYIRYSVYSLFYILLVVFGHSSKSLINESMSHCGEQGWHSGESTRLPPMWPGFDSELGPYVG